MRRTKAKRVKPPFAAPMSRTAAFEQLDVLSSAINALYADNERLRAALTPFADLAKGKDGWKDDSGCAVFPSMRLVRAARAALL